MAHLNHKGPKGKGSKTGRLLGTCRKTEEEQKKADNYQLGKGIGKKLKSGYGVGKGLRLKSSEMFD